MSSDSKFSPCPWTECPDYPDDVYAANGQLCVSAYILDDPNETAANRRLIAAAPELYEALQDVCAGCVNSIKGDRLVLNISLEAFKKMEAALRKAEGKGNEHESR